MARQIVPRCRRADCCAYHSADWKTASAAAVAALRHAQAAVAALRHAQAAVPAGEDFRSHLDVACAHLKASTGLDAVTLRWAQSLFADPIQPHYDVGGYTNGRHRAQAMLDAGVRRTVVGIWLPPQ
ncbi:hypothetical protein AB0I28_32290 [Phytomonospora sp. NPDC050363]|uniref:hypothetical protein n=1 Tax=Phytomonospora sp. NPDC050363 TaxID=3155642 RepID=UPI0033C29AFC